MLTNFFRSAVHTTILLFRLELSITTFDNKLSHPRLSTFHFLRQPIAMSMSLPAKGNLAGVLCSSRISLISTGVCPVGKRRNSISALALSFITIMFAIGSSVVGIARSFITMGVALVVVVVVVGVVVLVVLGVVDGGGSAVDTFVVVVLLVVVIGGGGSAVDALAVFVLLAVFIGGGGSAVDALAVVVLLVVVVDSGGSAVDALAVVVLLAVFIGGGGSAVDALAVVVLLVVVIDSSGSAVDALAVVVLLAVFIGLILVTSLSSSFSGMFLKRGMSAIGSSP
jgi:hypothetical protein